MSCLSLSSARLGSICGRPPLSCSPHFLSHEQRRTVVQPTLERAVDPNLQSQFTSYVTRASTVLGEGARTGSQFLSTGLQSGSQILKRETGYDVGDLGASYVDRVAGRGAGGGYAPVGTFESPSLQGEEEGEGEGDFFGSQLGGGGGRGASGYGSSGGSTPQLGGGGGGTGYRDEQAPVARGVQQQQQQDDGWAKLAPQSAAARGGSSGRASPATSVSSGSRVQRAPVSKKVEAPAKKDDDWDEW